MLQAVFSDKHPCSEAISITVVITTFNHSHFLADAISSVLVQTRPANAIIVVDDGSTDNPAAVVAKFDGVCLVVQANRGLSAARNTGLRQCITSHVMFLDADDRLLPHALESSMACAVARPDCAFVYGGHRRIYENGAAQGADRFDDVGPSPHLALLRGNLIGMHATVLYRRNRLVEANGFDESLPRCEDYDLYLRLAQKFQIAGHPVTVAEYRWHDGTCPVTTTKCSERFWRCSTVTNRELEPMPPPLLLFGRDAQL